MAKRGKEPARSRSPKKGATRSRPTSPETEAAGSEEGLAMVRNLLFGSQLRASEEKLDRAERLIRQEVNRLRTEIRRDLKALGRGWKTEIDALKAGLEAEASERADAEVKQRARVVGLGRRLDRKIESRAGKTTQSLQSIRKRVTAVSHRLEARFNESLEGVAASLHEEIEALRGDGADRETLAALFTELGKRVGGDATRS